MEQINKWIYWCYNYEYDFIDKIWGGTNLHQHFKEKFNGLYKTNGCRSVMNDFYAELDWEHRKRLMDYVLTNYKGEQKIPQ